MENEKTICVESYPHEDRPICMTVASGGVSASLYFTEEEAYEACKLLTMCYEDLQKSDSGFKKKVIF